MGHLINPISMRIGSVSSWEDVWYVKHIYYPEYLHIVLKIRLFLIYFFSLSQVENLGLFYSHFKLVKLYKNLCVNVYLYHSGFETLVATFFGESRSKFKKFVYESKEKKLPFFYNAIFDLFIIFKFILHGLKKSFLNFRMLFFFTNAYYDKIKKMLSSKRFCEISLKERRSFLMLLAAYGKLRKYMLNMYTTYKISFRPLVAAFFHSFLAINTLGPLFRGIKFFLALLFGVIASFKVLPYIFLINNDNVSAKFLARFLAKKLEQNYRVREIVNP
jgi:hypothetical protein